MKEGFELAKYDRRIWAVFEKRTRIFYYIGKGKRFCQNKVKELNSRL